MKTYFSLLISGLLFFAGVNIQAVRPENKTTPVYTYTPAADDAKEIIADIIAVIGLKANFEVMASADIPNAGAVTYRGKRYIAYNPQFITKLNVAAGNKWASVSVLAHEIGHHLNGHTLLNNSSQPPLELEADEFSGFVLKKMGATLSQSLAAMKIAADYKSGLTHPDQQARLSAITKGWNNAGVKDINMAKYSKPVIQEPVTEESVIAKKDQPATTRNENAVLDSRYVLATVDFPSDRSSNYYVTTAFNVVRVSSNGQLSVLGKMMRTNSEDYPFVMVGEKTGTLFIEKNGKIVTAHKEPAGFLRKA
ncbi:MAG TPA: M48 family metalloprotease [Ferruginibacter sp.]|nr:M48 family metalloprotease [Ferruginibacter sp.]